MCNYGEKIMFGISQIFSRNTQPVAHVETTRAETRLELLRILYNDGTQTANVGTAAFNVAIDLERRGFAHVRVGDVYPPAITISSRGIAFVEEIACMFTDDAGDFAQ